MASLLTYYKNSLYKLNRLDISLTFPNFEIEINTPFKNVSAWVVLVVVVGTNYRFAFNAICNKTATVLLSS